MVKIPYYNTRLIISCYSHIPHHPTPPDAIRDREALRKGGSLEAYILVGICGDWKGCVIPHGILKTTVYLSKNG
jgi:hypothetical protein